VDQYAATVEAWPESFLYDWSWWKTSDEAAALKTVSSVSRMSEATLALAPFPLVRRRFGQDTVYLPTSTIERHGVAVETQPFSFGDQLTFQEDLSHWWPTLVQLRPHDIGTRGFRSNKMAVV